MAEQSSPIDIRTPGLREALVNVNHLCAFEILRRFGRPATVAEVALSAQRSQKEIQSAMDALEAVGLTSMLRAGRGRRLPTWVVTRQAIVATYEIGDPAGLDLVLTVDGEARQTANTRDLVLDVPTLISWASSFYTLHPGDVISTGTPPGVGLGQKPPVYLRAGQAMRLGIDGLGVQVQRTVADPGAPLR
jgi:2-keto-4-pentenoate hydratase/2-oxohepta-3-ene-1,7-dioic acid hydratase in catechol pathway